MIVGMLQCTLGIGKNHNQMRNLQYQHDNEDVIHSDWHHIVEICGHMMPCQISTIHYAHDRKVESHRQQLKPMKCNFYYGDVLNFGKIKNLTYFFIDNSRNCPITELGKVITYTMMINVVVMMSLYGLM